MSFSKIFYILTLFVFSAAGIAQATLERDLIIQKAMDRLESQLHQNSSVGGNDVYYAAAQDPGNYNKYAETLFDIAPQAPFISYHETSWRVAPEVSYISYHEYSKVKEKGMMYGINGNYTLRPLKGEPLNLNVIDMYRFEGRFSYGKVDYNGSNIFKGIDDYMMEFRGLLGKDFNFKYDSVRLTPYWGGGYRFLFDSFHEDKPGGYDRKIQYAYIPVGAQMLSQINEGWALGADAEYDIFIYGSVISYLGQVGEADLSNRQNNGFGLRGSLQLIKKGDRFNFVFEPFIRYWHISKSNVAQSKPYSQGGITYVVVGYEPNNTSMEVGGKLAIEF